MDALTSILYYACAAVAVAAALVVAVLPGPAARGYGLLAFAVGVAGLLATLSAGFAAVCALIAFAACALLLGARALPSGLEPRPGLAVQLGGLAAALLLAALLYIGWRADFATGSYPGGAFGSAALGRLFFGRDALAFEAVGGLLLVALVAAGGLVPLGGRRR